MQLSTLFVLAVTVFTGTRALAQCIIDTPYSRSNWVLNFQTGALASGPFDVNGTSFAWPVDVPEGTDVLVELKDSDGNIVQTAVFTIRPGLHTGEMRATLKFPLQPV
ncbi:hypothetical protein C2E23DRAFT_863835 [Lenzites betulinus]|nr:hypothetical protein C2E23DRAFT_863835 [Lenzites betulinus]